MSHRGVALGLLLAICGYTNVVSAHESRPLYIEIEEKAPSVFTLQWRTPPTVPAKNAPKVQLPDGCDALTPEPEGRTRKDHITRHMVRCESPLAGRALEVHYPYFNPSVSTLVRITWLSGETRSLVSPPDESVIQVPNKESRSGVAKQYLVIGMHHILEGFDHLLFLLLLLVIARTPKRILTTITGFTLAHSLTLVLSTLGVVHLPVAPVEAAIALSIVFLATEILRNDRTSLTYRHPIAVSSSFGLLHGFGFATVLGEVGLPQTELPTALLFFNVGVEIGQILFVALVVGMFVGARKAATLLGASSEAFDTRATAAERPAVYLVGSLAAFWMVQRVVSFWVA